MSRIHRQKPRRRFLGRVKHRPLKSITLLPSLVTILNGVFGFAAIIYASHPYNPEGSNRHYSMAGFMILLGMIADTLDGRLARMSQTTSSFGGQLDSLCDMISFGVAPAFLMLKIMLPQLDNIAWPHPSLLERFLWLTALIYLCCAAIRLARFNVENVEQESGHMAFVGLPSPAAAGVVISFVLFQQEVAGAWSALLWLLPILTFGVGILMVSRVVYPHVVNQYLKGRKPLGHLIKILLLSGLVWCSSWQAALFFIFGSFAVSGLFRQARKRWARRHRPEKESIPNETLNHSDPI